MSSAEPLYTNVGHTGIDELHFRGHAVFADLLGKTTFGQLVGLAVSGRLHMPIELAALDDIFAAMSSADPRLWPFKIARIGSACGHASYGVACTLAAGEGGVFGPNRLKQCADFLVGLRDAAVDGEPSDDAILAALTLDQNAFGVLYRSKDERFKALMAQTTKRGRETKPFTRLCLRIVELARAEKKLEPHVYFGVAAVALDLGWSADSVAMLALFIVFYDALPNAAEGAKQRPRVLQEASYAAHVCYEGHAPRSSPKARMPTDGSA